MANPFLETIERLAKKTRIAFRILRLTVAIATAERAKHSRGLSLDSSNTFGRFINLDQRVDRKILTEQELAKMGMSFVERTAGNRASNGALGCARAHLAVLTQAIIESHDYAVVTEDDIMLVGSIAVLSKTLEEFLQNDLLDVLCLGNRTQGFRLRAGRHLDIAFDIQTTSFYIAKKRAISELIGSAAKSVNLLDQGLPAQHGAIDIIWKEKQVSSLVFCVPREKIIVQRPSHSDVTGKFKHYGD